MARSGSAAEFLKALDRVASPVFAFDGQRRLRFANAACCNWLGVAAIDLLGQPGKYVAADEIPASHVGSQWASLLCPPPPAFAGQIVDYTRAWPLDEQAVELWFQAVPLRDEAGEVALVVVLPIDQSTADERAQAAVQTEEVERLHQALRNFFREQASRYCLDRLVGNSPQIEGARRQAALAAQCRANVFISGPKGSGREWLARTIYQRGLGDTPPTALPLIPLACGMLAEDLLASTLAAAVKAHPGRPGANQATGALLLLDLDQLPPTLFSEFTQFLSPRRSSLWILSTSAHSAADLVASAKFPISLTTSCATLEIKLPALAQRLEDLPLLVQLLVEQFNAAGDKQLAGAAPETIDALAAYGWSGNLVELERTLAAACAAAPGSLVQPADLPREFQHALAAQTRPKRAIEAIKLPQFLGEVERELITRALAQTKGNKAKAARLLGVSRPALLRRLARLKLD